MYISIHSLLFLNDDDHFLHFWMFYTDYFIGYLSPLRFHHLCI